MKDILDEIRKQATLLELHLMEDSFTTESVAEYIAKIENATSKLYALNVVG